MEGYFSLKATPLGANLCLLEAVDEGEIQALLKDGGNWLINGLKKSDCGRRNIWILKELLG